jgi:hypothetical protein
LRLGRENLLEFVWRDGIIAPYPVIAPYRDAFAGKRNRIRPFCLCGAKPLSNWIAEDVIIFFGEVRVIAKTRIKEITLETNAEQPRY